MNKNFPTFYQEHLFILRQNLTRYRKKLGWTQQQLAEMANISVGYLASIEAPHSDAVPSFEMICLLAFYLEVEPSDLMFLDSEIL